MKLIAVFIACFAVAFADECKDAFKVYATCVKTKHDGYIDTIIADGQSKLEDLKSCFSADSEGVECDFPDLQIGPPDLPQPFEEETVACIRKAAWVFRVKQLATCAANPPAFVIEGLKEVEPHHSAMQTARFIGNVKKMKKAMNTCKANGIDHDHWHSIKNCVKTKVMASMETHNEERCAINQRCITTAFTGHESCIPDIQDSKEDMCRCWTDHILPEVISNFEMIARRHTWTDEDEARMGMYMQPFLDECNAEMPPRPPPEEETGRHRRHYRSRREHSHHDHAEGHHNHDGRDMPKPAPIFCQCNPVMPVADTW